jgi:carbon monoxide dehydrogenase subunit G
MSEFKSTPVLIGSSDEEIFNFLASFNNFEKLMPEQVTNWQSTHDSCSFTITGMADLAMKMDRKEANSLVSYASDGNSPFPFQLSFDLSADNENRCRVQANLSAKLNPMLKMMASRPLQNFVNLLVEKLKEVMESA